MGLFYKNYIESDLLQPELDRLVAEGDPNLFFMIYPSWRFRFSCNVVMSTRDVLIEGKFGSQKGLAMGTDVPDFSVSMPFGFRSMMRVLTGGMVQDVSKHVGRIIYYVGKTLIEDAYAEVAVTDIGQLIFYELFDLGRSPAALFRK